MSQPPQAIAANDAAHWCERPTLAAIAGQLADDTAQWLADAIATNGAAYLAVPGGKTPAPFFDALSIKPLHWPSVHVTLTDERWVEQTSEQSNARLVAQTLLRNAAASATFSPPQFSHTATIDEAARQWDITLQGWPAFDLVVLGMGEDGHIASLFPNAQGIDAAMDTALPALTFAALDRSPQRLSLTMRAICRSQRVVILGAGETKRTILESALRGDDSTAHLPIAQLFRALSQKPHIYWGTEG